MTRVASRARRTPASGSYRIEPSPSPSKLGKRRAPSVGRERSTGTALLAEDALALLRPSRRAAEEPGDAAGDEELLPRVLLELAPELERAREPSACTRRCAVRAADQPRLPARRRTDVAGRVLLDERDLPAARDEPECERAAEDPGADDDRARQAGSSPAVRCPAARPRARACPCAGSARAARPRGRPARGRRARASAASSDASGRRASS